MLAGVLAAVLACGAMHPAVALARDETRRERPRDPWVPAEAARATALASDTPAAPWVSVQVNVAANGGNIPGDAANEPSIAVDPTDPKRIVIGWRQFDSVTSNFRQAGWAYSTDAGRTWNFAGVLQPGVFRTDPVLACDPRGTFYYASITPAGDDFACDVFASSDGGVSWTGPTGAYGGDKPWLVVDRTSGIGSGNLYCAWSVTASCCGANTFTRSTDGNLSFEPPAPVNGNPQWGSMDVGPDGSLYLAGIERGDPSRVLVAKSARAQDPGEPLEFDFVRSADLGGTFRLDLGISSPNPYGFLGQVWIAADRSSGPTAGNLYLLCSLDPPGPDPMDVLFARSIDGGSTWSAPVRVNKDAGTAWQWFGTMSVAPNGRIDVVWNDTRNTGRADRSQLYCALSVDGGVTWSANVALSFAWDSHAGWPNQAKIGDYYHMVSDAVGANLAWAATLNGEQDVWFLRLGDYDCNGNGVGDGADLVRGTSTDWNWNRVPDECEGLSVSDAGASRPGWRLDTNVPNPFNPSTAIRFETARAGPVRLEIADVTGRIVRVLGASAPAGRSAVVWDGRDQAGLPAASGVYLCRLRAAGFEASRRMTLVR